MIHAAQNLSVNVPSVSHGERRGGDIFFPFGEAVSKSKVRVEKVSAGSQHAHDLRQKSWEVGITVRRLDIDDCVEGVRFKW